MAINYKNYTDKTLLEMENSIHKEKDRRVRASILANAVEVLEKLGGRSLRICSLAEKVTHSCAVNWALAYEVLSQELHVRNKDGVFLEVDGWVCLRNKVVAVSSEV